MNPGPVEEIGKATGSFIEAMKVQPLALALCAMNLFLMALFWYLLHALDHRTAERERLLAQEQKDIRELLAKCVVPRAGIDDNRTTGYKLQSDESAPVELPPQ
jgi:hypothetical protein